MIIKAKETKKIIYKSIGYIVIGVGSFFYIYNSVEKVDNIFVFLALAFSIFLIMKGLFHALEISYCKQDKTYEFLLKDGIFYLDNDKQFILKESYLFFELNECDKNIAVSLHQEKDAKIITIFQKIIFTPPELKVFLKLIKPYRKFDTFPWKKNQTHDDLYVCREGFILKSREFFYEEVATIRWITEEYYVRLARFERVHLEIELKNKELIIKTFRNSKRATYLKFTYILSRAKNKNIANISDSKRFIKAFNKMVDEIEKKGYESL